MSSKFDRGYEFSRTLADTVIDAINAQYECEKTDEFRTGANEGWTEMQFYIEKALKRIAK